MIIGFKRENGVQSDKVATKRNKYRLYQDPRCLRDFEPNYYRGLRAKRKGLYIGFLGVLNPVDTDGARYKVFRL